MTPGSLHTASSVTRSCKPASEAGSVAPALPWGLSFETPLEDKPDWQLAIEMLPQRDPETEYYRPQDVRCVLPISASQVRRHCADLWGSGDRREWRLNFSQICSLIKRIFFTGRTCLSTAELRRRYQEHLQQRSQEATLAQQWATQHALQLGSQIPSQSRPEAVFNAGARPMRVPCAS